jgi:hypothetical protein
VAAVASDVASRPAKAASAAAKEASLTYADVKV